MWHNKKWNVLKCLVEADVWERIGGVQTNVAHWTFDVIFRLEPVKNVFEDTWFTKGVHTLNYHRRIYQVSGTKRASKEAIELMRLKGDDGIIWLSRQGHRSLRGRPFFSYSAISRRQSAPTWVAMPFWTEYLLAAYLGAFLMMSSDFLSKWEMRKWENWQDQLTPLTRAAVLFNLPRAVA